METTGDNLPDDVSVSSLEKGQECMAHFEGIIPQEEHQQEFLNDLQIPLEDQILGDDAFSLDASIFGDLKPPELPEGWEKKLVRLYDVQRGCPPSFSLVDNPGLWHSFSYVPKFKGRKSSDPYIGHYLPTGATVCPPSILKMEDLEGSVTSIRQNA